MRKIKIQLLDNTKCSIYNIKKKKQNTIEKTNTKNESNQYRKRQNYTLKVRKVDESM